jgi:hypothetical protein
VSLSDWNFGPDGPEILVDIGTTGMKRGLAYDLIQAEMGSGYYASANVGLPLRTWSLTWAATKHDISENPAMVIPLYDDGKIVEGPSAGTVLTFVISPVDGTITTNATYGDMQTRMKYFQRFFGRRMQAQQQPFVFVDPAERGAVPIWQEPYNYAAAHKWLVRLLNVKQDFQQGGRSNFWSYSCDLIQVRPGYYGADELLAKGYDRFE